jgi:competence protein ComEC
MLSYGALFGILLTGRFLTKLFIRFMPYYFAGSVSASCGAQLFTTPVSLKLFGSFSPVGIAATVIVSPLISIFIYSALFLILLCLVFPCLASYSAIFVEIEYNLIKFAVRGFSHAPVWSIS